jgi:hypothetical protein
MSWILNTIVSAIAPTPLPIFPPNHDLYYQEYFLFNILSFLRFKEATKVIISNSQWYNMIKNEDSIFYKCTIWIRYVVQDIQRIESNESSYYNQFYTEKAMELYPTFIHVMNERNRVMEFSVRNYTYSIEFGSIIGSCHFRVYDTTVKQLDAKIKQITKGMDSRVVRGYFRKFTLEESNAEDTTPALFRPIQYPLPPLMFHSIVGHTTIGHEDLDTMQLYKVSIGCNVL